MKFRVLLLLALFLAVIPAIPLQAQQGLLLLEKGSVKVIGPERTRLLRKPGAKMALHAKDRVQTGKDTTVKIKIKGKPEIIELSSRSFFRMGKITRQTSSISLLTGKARFKIQGKLKKKSKRKRFQIRTVTALVGVRGTDFVVGASNTQTSLLTISGTVSLAPVNMPDIEIEVPANQASTVQKNSTPTAPVEVAPKMRAQILRADSPKAFRIVKFGEAVKPEEVRKENEKKKKEEEEEQKKEEEKPPQDKEGEPKPGDEKGPGPEGKEGPGMPGEGEEDEEGMMMGPGSEGKPGDDEGPRGPGMPGEGQNNEGGMMMGPEGVGPGADTFKPMGTEFSPDGSFGDDDDFGASFGGDEDFGGNFGGDPGGDFGGDFGGDPGGEPGDFGGDPGGNFGGDPKGDPGGNFGGETGGDPGGTFGGDPGDFGGGDPGDFGDGDFGGDPGDFGGGDYGGGDDYGDYGGGDDYSDYGDILGEIEDTMGDIESNRRVIIEINYN